MTMQTKQASAQSESFQIKHSLTVLIIAFLAGSFFAVLLCFYPGPESLGSDFLPIFSLFALLALGALLKMFFRKPILQIDHLGINFFSSKNFIPWSRVHKATLMAVARDGEGDNPKNFFVVQYIDTKEKEIMEIDFSITGMMDKNEANLEAALQKFNPAYTTQ